jgi:hypothetical protein
MAPSRHRSATGTEPAPSACPLAELVEDYARFLQEHRGLRSTSIAKIRRTCDAMRAFFCLRRTSPDAIEPAVIHKFNTSEGNRCNRRTLSGNCSDLRGFLGQPFSQNPHRALIIPEYSLRRLLAP